MDFTDKETLHRIDVRVGENIRRRRTELRMTQQHLASAIGVTFQQVQKYENAQNRISVGRLYAISRVLDEPVALLFSEAFYSKTLKGRNLGCYRSAIENALTRMAIPHTREDGSTFLLVAAAGFEPKGSYQYRFSSCAKIFH